MKVKVYKDGLDWCMWCSHHDQRVWCESQADAYEMAAGHCVMHHSAQCGEYFYGYRKPGTLYTDWSVPRICTLPARHQGLHGYAEVHERFTSDPD